MSLVNSDPPTSPSAARFTPPTGVTRTPTARSAAATDHELSAPMGFEVLLREINSVVELLERIDQALDQETAEAAARPQDAEPHAA